MPPTRHLVAAVSEIPPGSRKIVQIGRRSIGVFNVNGEFYAIRNQCPHQGAPLCRGTLSGAMLPAGLQEDVSGLEGRVLRCPWHSWGFDVTTREMAFVSEPMRLKTYEVAVEPPELERYEVGVEENLVVVHI